MARVDILKEIYCKKMLIKDFDFDGLFHPPLSKYLSDADIIQLRYLATSAKWASKTKEEKFGEVDKILKPRGFARFGSGTNRIVYENIYDHSFVLKVAIDEVGMRDSPDELYNQSFVKPFVTKVFDVSHCGTVALVERVNPITNRHQFEDIAGEIFDILHNFFIGKYVLEDIGTDFFKNWGIRDGFGPVLLDFPYLYETDGDKLQCSKRHPNGVLCDGTIDYDNGLNTLVCEKCNQRYAARDLGKVNHIRDLKSKIIEGVSNMEKEIQVSIFNDGKEYKLYSETDCIASNTNSRTPKKRRGEEDLIAYVTGGYYATNLVNPEVIKTIDKKMKASIADPTDPVLLDEKVMVSVQTTVASPDIIPAIEENFTEVKPKQFKPSSKNSKLEIQDDKIEKAFVEATKMEQGELEKRESVAKSKVTAKERALMSKFMTAQMKKFQFEDYAESSQNQRTDMIDYLVASISAKYVLEPEMSVMITTEFIDGQYHFDADKQEDLAKAEDLAKQYYGDKSYEDEDTVEPIVKRGGISKDF